MPGHTILKRKRTVTDDEGSENNPPSERHAKNAEEPHWADGILSPESEPLGSMEGFSEADSDLASSSDQHSHRGSNFRQTTSQFRGVFSPLTPVADRLSPLPVLSWADPQEVWERMCYKNEISMSQRDEDLFSKHPQLQPRMRAILLDWLIEVCEVYKLHRETYHLSIDFIDRYLSNRRDIPKGQLQLIGITCLFVAAKVEEIYPPKINEFAYVTDGACTETEILDKELIILKTLNWNLSPVTVNGWLTMYMQLCCGGHHRNGPRLGKTDMSSSFVYPQYSGLTFIQTVQLVDLCTLDEGCLRYSYSVLAAAALYHMSSKDLALSVSGLCWEDISDCVQWTLPFALTVHEESASRITSAVCQGTASSSESAASSGLLKSVPHIVMDNSHNIQTHTIDLQMLEKAQSRQKHYSAASTSTDITDSATDVSQPDLMTPPASQKKPSEHKMALTGSYT